MRRHVNITVAGQNMGTQFIDEEFADGVEKYNFKDMKEFSDMMFHIERCTRKGYFDWCPADTKTVKRLLGMEVE